MIGLQAALRATPFALTAELAPMPDAAALLARAQRLRDHVDAIQITQNTSKAQLGDIRVSGNYLNDGGCTLNVARTPAPIGTFSVTDNEFGPDRTYSGCGILAPDMNAPQQSGNVWESTGTAVTRTVLK